MTASKIDGSRIFRFLKQVVSLTVLPGLAAGILIFMPESTESAASQFDQTFGTAGKVITDFNGGTDSMYDLAVQADGKIVAVGNSAGFAVARYNVSGTLDNTFDGDGKVTTNAQTLNTAYAVAIQADGKIVVGGFASSVPPTFAQGFALARYNSNGSLDTTFDADGIVLTPLAGMSISDIVIQPDGKIVAVGASSGDVQNFAVARYNTNGSLDTSFDLDGYLTTSLADSDVAACVALQPDGKIIVGGQIIAPSYYALARYNTNGSLDTSFDTDGLFIVSLGNVNYARAVVVQPDGKIIAAGATDNNMSLIRLLPSGVFDTTFNFAGYAIVDFGGADNSRAAALQPDGKIILAGESDNGIAVARFNSNGLLDTDFHGDGRFDAPIQDNLDIASAVAIQPDGRIVAGGRSTNNFVLTRFLGDPRSVQTNSQVIAPADRGNNANPPGIPATNYPSIINVGGLNGAVTKVRVSLNNITHTFRGDLDILLVGPQGQQTILISDVDTTVLGNAGFINQTVSFDQSAAAEFPTTPPVNGGIYKPFNRFGNTSIEPNSIDVFPAPGPGLQNYGAANLNVFNGTNPNGQWKLYVVDDEMGDIGSIGGWTLDVTTTTSRLNNLTSDFDGDGKADVSVFRPSNGTWYLQQSAAGFASTPFGLSGDVIAPADFDADGKTDLAVFRNGTWYLQRSSLGFTGIAFGQTGDLPRPADFDADGRADLAVFRPSNGIWYLNRSTAGFTGIQFGTNGDAPVPADYDGDGKSDLAVFRPSNGTWYLQRSTAGFTGIQFGQTGDAPVPADYDNDGRTDVAVFRANTWYLNRSSLGVTGIQFGSNGDVPTAADYDGDGTADLALFRPSNGIWYLQRSQSGFTGIQFGTNGDKPVPSAFVP